jgi:RNA polymerase sigma-70 factor (ECF subfamily)
MISEQTTEQFGTGDRKAFEIIYNEYAPTLLKFLQKHNVKDAEDIVEDTFIRLWNNRVSIQPDKKLFSYLCTIACNLVNDRHDHYIIEKKYSDAVKQTDIEQMSYSIENELIDKDRLQCINRGIKKLTPRQQEIFNLSRKQGFTYREIAQKLGIHQSSRSMYQSNFKTIA